MGCPWIWNLMYVSLRNIWVRVTSSTIILSIAEFWNFVGAFKIFSLKLVYTCTQMQYESKMPFDGDIEDLDGLDSIVNALMSFTWKFFSYYHITPNAISNFISFWDIITWWEFLVFQSVPKFKLKFRFLCRWLFWSKFFFLSWRLSSILCSRWLLYRLQENLLL